jgi:tetratricopeptide (TPR) repeat protein
MSQQTDTVAGLLAKMERQMSRGQVVSQAEITEALLACQAPEEPLDAITQDLMESQGVDMRVVQKPGTLAVPPHVEAQIGELVAAQGAVAAQGRTASAESLYRLGMLAAYGRDFAAALDYFHQATQADPGLHGAYQATAWLQQSRAMDDIFASNYGLAVDKLKDASHAAAQIQPPDAQTLALQGYIAKSLAQAAAPVADQDQERGYYQQAAGFFRRASALDPVDVSAQNGLANVAYALGDVEGAIQAFRQVVIIEPNYTAAWHDLGVACVTQMQHSDPAQVAVWRDEALRAFREAHRLAQEDPTFSEEAIHRVMDYVEWLERGDHSETNSPS